MTTFSAIDFETADHQRDSACSVGVVKVRDGRIVMRWQRLIRPPRRDVVFTYIHGIAWRHVSKQPTFRELWPELSQVLRDCDYLAAHNAPFDSGVLGACCSAAKVERPKHRFVCTVGLARAVWGIFPTNLPSVCSRLGIKLDHHKALSDAEACARIVMLAGRAGARLPEGSVDRSAAN